ncbi:MAG: hypothetical protein HFH67_01670 [Lachnospiraceae bacterium]|nr:hypothetical protein [Lachnospiraceae bacterium]
MMKKKYIKYAVMAAAVSCCLLFQDKSTSSANVDKDIEESAIYSANETGTNVPQAYKEVAGNDETVNGYPEVKYKYEVDDNGDITVFPFLQYAYINEDGGIEWSEPVKDIDKAKEYFNEEMISIISDGGKHKVDTSMLEE